jgi:probable 2-oxoglutarate dehydrogenase E1 component DHKTD1
MHGHCAAHLDPLDLIQQEGVAGLDPARYSLTNESKKYNVNGIIWTKPVGGMNAAEEWCTLGSITRHLRDRCTSEELHTRWWSISILSVFGY